MLPKSEIMKQLETIFKEVFDDADLRLEEQTSADDIEAWDSVTHINIVMMAEEHFKVRFRTSDIAALKNVGDFVNLIESQMA